MTIETFKEYAKTRQALDTEEIRRFMDEMSNEARRVTFRLNASFHTRFSFLPVPLPGSAVAPRLPAVLYGLR